MTPRSPIISLFWKIYGAFWESYARKTMGIQGVHTRKGVYFIDRKTGEPVLGYSGENLNPPKSSKARHLEGTRSQTQEKQKERKEP